MGIPCKNNGTLNKYVLLDHVEDAFILVQPQVVIWDRHGLKCDLLGIFEEGIGSPHFLQPVHFQKPGGHFTIKRNQFRPKSSMSCFLLAFSVRGSSPSSLICSHLLTHRVCYVLLTTSMLIALYSAEQVPNQSKMG